MTQLETVNPSAEEIAPARSGISRLNWILLGALVAQIALIAITYWPTDSANNGDAPPLLASLPFEEVDRVTIANNEGVATELVKSGDGWVLPAVDDYPALSNQVDEMLAKLQEIGTDRLVARTPESHSRLGVADESFERKITLQTPDMARTIYVGTSAGAGATHVRSEGEDETYLTSEISAWEVNAPVANWVELLYVTLSAQEIVGIQISNASGEFDLTRDENGEWQMEGLTEGETLASDRISSLLTQVATVRMVAPVGAEEQPEFGLETPAASVAITTRGPDGQEVTTTYAVGARTEPEDEESDYYFKSSESDYFVTIPSYTAEGFTAKTRSDYLAEPTAEDNSSEEAFPALSSD